MILIKFECNSCGSIDGELNIFFDEPIIVCRKCEEHEPIKSYDIIGYETEIN